MIDQIIEGLFLTLRYDTFVLMALGLFGGMLVGALPGFTTLMAMAILLPISFFLDPVVGIPFLLGVYKGGIFGGSIPAILVSMPGTGAAVATTTDGYQLTKKGQSRKALDMALFSSVIGDTASDIFTLLMIVPIAYLVLQFGPPEIFAILILSIVIVAVTAGHNPLKGLIMLTVGLWLSFIGSDPIGGMERFTFGLFDLRDGIPLLPLLIGIFAIPEIAKIVGRKTTGSNSVASILGERLSRDEFKRCIRTICRSTVIGTMIGIIPGLGQMVAAVMGYTAAKNASPVKENFGKGELEGVAAAEAANNAVNGPTMVPLLTLGIPGDNVTAILLGAFVAQGLRPGPQLFTDQGPVVFGILIAMVIANIMFLAIGYVSIPFFSRIVTIKSNLLVPLVTMFALAGAYVYHSNPTDIIILAVFGVIGMIANAAKFEVMPLVMGFILGVPIERAFGQTLSLANGDFLNFALFERPIMVAILVATPFLAWLIRRKMYADKDNDKYLH